MLREVSLRYRKPPRKPKYFNLADLGNLVTESVAYKQLLPLPVVAPVPARTSVIELVARDRIDAQRKGNIVGRS